jgi:HD-like signal output (HDOD) protein
MTLHLSKSQRLVASSINLVTLPAIYLRVKRVLDDKDASVSDLARVISVDPGMTARVLKLINSSFWGLSGKVDSLDRALALLGMRPVHDLVLATSVVDAFDRVRPELMDIARFWQTSVYRALAAVTLARLSGQGDSGRVFAQALMSNLGHMVLFIKEPVLSAAALKECEKKPWALAATEQELLGCDFAEVGAELAQVWQLPASFVQSIRHQNQPDKAGMFALDASLLHVAGVLSGLSGGLADSTEHLAQISPFAWKTLALGPDCLAQVVPEVEINLMMTAQMFGVPLAG